MSTDTKDQPRSFFDRLKISSNNVEGTQETIKLDKETADKLLDLLEGKKIKNDNN